MSILPRYSPHRLAALAVLAGFEPPALSNSKILELDPRDVATSVRIARSIAGAELDLVVSDHNLEPHVEATNIAIIQRENKANNAIDPETLKRLNSRAPYDFIVSHFPNDLAALFGQLAGLCGSGTMVTCVTRVRPGASINRWIADYLRIAGPLIKFDSSKAALESLAQLLVNDERPFPSVVRRELERVVKLPLSRIDELFRAGEKPCLFDHILRIAAQGGFTYLGDAEMDSSVLREELMPQERFDELRKHLPEELEQEQFLDCLLFRSVRQPVFASGKLTPDLRPLHERLAFARLSLTVELEDNDDGSLSASANGLNRFEITDRVAVEALRAIKKHQSIECYRLISQVLESFRIPYGEQLTVREYLVGVIDMYLRLGFLELRLDQ